MDSNTYTYSHRLIEHLLLYTSVLVSSSSSFGLLFKRSRPLVRNPSSWATVYNKCSKRVHLRLWWSSFSIVHIVHVVQKYVYQNRSTLRRFSRIKKKSSANCRRSLFYEWKCTQTISVHYTLTFFLFRTLFIPLYYSLCPRLLCLCNTQCV